MLYLIRTFGRTIKQRAVKVGFSDSPTKRFLSYYHQNPYYETIGVRCGDLYMETKTHLYLESLGYKQNFLNEWFLDIPEVLMHFHDTEEKMNHVIWKNRERLFSVKDFKPSGNTIKKRIYEDLRGYYFNEKYSKKIDIDWLREDKKVLLKKIKNTFYYD